MSLAFCKVEPWLGEGFYFWESFIENAEEWGIRHYKKRQKSYQILKACYEEQAVHCLNLIDNAEQIKEFNDAVALVENEAGVRMHSFYQRITMLRKYAPKYFGKFSCVRIFPCGGMVIGKIPFTEKMQKVAYYTPIPPIQVCFWKNEPKKFIQVKIVL